MRFLGNDESANTRYFVAAEDAARLSDQARQLLDRAVGIEWYGQPGSDVDRAALTLCLLRRASAGEKGARRGEHARARVAGEPRCLLHGRERLPGSCGPLVNGREPRDVGVSLLSVSTPEEERQRSECGGREVGRERHSPRLLPSDHGRAAPKKSAGLLARCADVALDVDASPDR